MTSELFLGQMCAVALGIYFFVVEYVRLGRNGSPRPVLAAFLEAMRFWAFIAAAELTFWFAIQPAEALVRTAIIAIGTILAAVVINNAYVVAHRKVHAVATDSEN